MSKLTTKKAVIISAVAGILALTGCTAKPGSQVTVSPLGMNNQGGVYGGDSQYMGDALVSNSEEVVNAASSLQSIVYFQYDSSAITTEASAKLDQHVSLLNEFSGSRILIVGHTDSRGSREYNMALGERRAQAVREYLSAQDIDTSNVEIMSRGKEEATGNHDQDRKAVLSY